MRSFVAVIAITSIIGLLTARQEFAVSAQGDKVNVTIDRISDIAARPLTEVLPPPPPPPPKPPVNKTGAVFANKLSSQHYVIVDHVTDEVLQEMNSDESRSLASITKLMSALIVSEHVHDWTATTTVTAQQVSEGNQTIGAGEVYTLHDLYIAALVGSINTAMNTLVAATGLTEEQFVAEMNSRAQELGMHTMRFVEPTGLSPENVASARDVARLTKIVMSHPLIKVTSVMDRATITEQTRKQKRLIKATDWFLTDTVPLKGAVVEGGKTGFIPESGYNFTVQLRSEQGREVRVVVLGAKDVYSRFTESAALATWVFDNFAWE